MKTTMLLLALTSLTATAGIGEKKIRPEGAAVYRTREGLEKAFEYFAKGDKEAAKKSSLSSGMLTLKGGTEIFEMESYKYPSGMIRIRVVGDKTDYWTFRSAHTPNQLYEKTKKP